MRTMAKMTVATLASLALLACSNPDDSETQNQSEGEETATDLPEFPSLEESEEVSNMVPDEISDRGSITVAVNTGLAPVKMTDESGNITGIAPQLLDGAGQVMGLDVELEEVPFDSLIPGLTSERFDVIASISDLPERRDQIDFINYMEYGTAVLVPANFEADSIELNELCGLTVGHTRGTAQDSLIDELSQDCESNGDEAIDAKAFDASAAGVVGVESGQLDAFWGDSSSMAYNASMAPDTFKVVYEEIEGPYGVGVLNTEQDLREALRSALQEMESNGTYQEIMENWGSSDVAMPELPLNTGE